MLVLVVVWSYEQCPFPAVEDIRNVGYEGRWLPDRMDRGAHAGGRSHEHRVMTAPTLADIADAPEQPAVIAVDMPIGLPTGLKERAACRSS